MAISSQYNIYCYNTVTSEVRHKDQQQESVIYLIT